MTILGLRIMSERTYQAEQEIFEKRLALAEKEIARRDENKNFWMRQANEARREFEVSKHWPHANRITVKPKGKGHFEIEVARS